MLKHRVLKKGVTDLNISCFVTIRPASFKFSRSSWNIWTFYVVKLQLCRLNDFYTRTKNRKISIMCWGRWYTKMVGILVRYSVPTISWRLRLLFAALATCSSIGLCNHYVDTKDSVQNGQWTIGTAIKSHGSAVTMPDSSAKSCSRWHHALELWCTPTLRIPGICARLSNSFKTVHQLSFCLSMFFGTKPSWGFCYQRWRWGMEACLAW